MATISLKDISIVCNLEDTDWKVVSLPLKQVKTIIPESELYERKKNRYAKLLQEGVELPAIIINSKNDILDGQCRFGAHQKLKKRRIWCIKEAGEGTGLLK